MKKYIRVYYQDLRLEWFDTQTVVHVSRVPQLESWNRCLLSEQPKNKTCNIIKIEFFLTSNWQRKIQICITRILENSILNYGV